MIAKALQSMFFWRRNHAKETEHAGHGNANTTGELLLLQLPQVLCMSLILIPRDRLIQ